ncbi:MAG: copper oxidase [Acidobacteriaceae bacterium]
MKNRRDFLRNTFGFGAGLAAAPRLFATGQQRRVTMDMSPHTTGRRIVDEIASVQTPDIPQLPWRMDGKVKEFHLIAEPVKQEIVPGRVVDLWGYNGSAPGPTIQINQGDRVRIIVDNHLPEATSMHWHGFEIPNEMDGAPGSSQDPIPPGGRFVYDFTLHQEGTYFYHSHMAMQEMMGMIGAFIMHPREPHHPRVDKDFAVIMQEYAILPNNSVPNSMNMEFNWLTLNGKSGPATTPLIVRYGERVRIRLINLGMDHHPIHLHGHTFVVTGSEGGRQPQSTWGPGNTVLVGVAQSRDIEFVASNPGDWMLHCHLPHHMMNQMSSMVGPMSRKSGMPAGLDMERGMGMLRQGSATSSENGPSLGRGLGVGSTAEQTVSNSPSFSPAHHEDSEKNTRGMQMSAPQVSANANSVPGFPQDAFMEGPAMAMDEMVGKPENFGLRPGWSGFMAGMMTFIRVLPPDKYDHIVELRKKRSDNTEMQMDESDTDQKTMEHKHE